MQARLDSIGSDQLNCSGSRSNRDGIEDSRSSFLEFFSALLAVYSVGRFLVSFDLRRKLGERDVADTCSLTSEKKLFPLYFLGGQLC